MELSLKPAAATAPSLEVSSLAAYQPSADRPWNRERAAHLLRRLNFGGSPEEIEAVLSVSPAQAVDLLINQALELPLSDEPEWAYWDVSKYEDIDVAIEQKNQWAIQWVKDMLKNGFREKLALFWHNHFVTQQDVYQCPSHLYQYHKLLQEYALGNFRVFVEKIGLTPAMLVYLNGVQNSRFEPNENYARELYELFTLGRDNGYTQDDIKETARALTGYVGYFSGCGPIGFVEQYHDKGEKTIFGKTAAYNYESLHELLFTERADVIATYICSKIYRHFVSPVVNEDIVSGMALTFKQNNFELAPVFRQLFKSEHFFDQAIIGTQISSPLVYYLGFIRSGGFEVDNEELLAAIGYFAFQLGQRLFDPVDVAGWPGNRSWINNNTITLRWQSLELYLFTIYGESPERLRTLAKTLSDNSNNAELVSQAIVDHFTPRGLQSAVAYESALDVFKAQVPQNYFDNGQWNLDWDIAPAQVALLLQFLSQQPEFQLA